LAVRDTELAAMEAGTILGAPGRPLRALLVERAWASVELPLDLVLELCICKAGQSTIDVRSVNT